VKLLATLFSFNGRMDRGRFWAVQLGLLLVSGLFTLWDVLHDVNSVMAALGGAGASLGAAAGSAATAATTSPDSLNALLAAATGQGAGGAGQGTLAGLLTSGILGMSPLEWIVTVVLGWIYLATQAKRFHDVGRSGWWVLLNLIPLIGPLWAGVVTGFYRSTAGPNRYGPEP
jgi:uncharacterized membrane protein YhaH (DUF805 family)